MEEKYKKLFSLSENDFLVALQKLSVEQLDREALLDFLRSPYFGIRKKAQILLLKYFPKELDYETLLKFFEPDDDSRVKEWSLLDTFNAQELDYEILTDFLRSTHPEIRNTVWLLLRKYLAADQLTLSFETVEEVLSHFS